MVESLPSADRDQLLAEGKKYRSPGSYELARAWRNRIDDVFNVNPGDGKRDYAYAVKKLNKAKLHRIVKTIIEEDN